MKYEVGDRVKTNGGGFTAVKHEGEIVEVRSGGYRIKTKCDYGSGEDTLYYTEREVSEKISDAPKRAFKVGEKIKIPRGIITLLKFEPHPLPGNGRKIIFREEDGTEDWCAEMYLEMYGELIEVSPASKPKYKVGWFIKCKNDNWKEVRDVGRQGYLLGRTASTKETAKHTDNDDWWTEDEIEKHLITTCEPFTESSEGTTLSEATLRGAIDQLKDCDPVPRFYFSPEALWGKSLFESITEPLAPRKESKMSVIKALKAKLSPTDRTLVRHGYLTNTGERTSTYESELRDAVMSRLIEEEDTKEFRDELARALKEEDED